MLSNEYVAALIIKTLKGEISPEEQAELDRWAGQSESHQMTMDTFMQESKLAKGIQEHWVEDRLWARLDGLVAATSHAPRHVFLARRFLVAASIALLAGVGIYFLRVNGRSNSPVPQTVTAGLDVAAPTRVKATITLASGEKVSIDSLSKGTLASQGRVKIVKLGGGELAYTGKDNEIFVNTLSNPRGSQVVALTLADGTRVWLNAASSIRYPTGFTGSDREVEVTGEAYFEVAKNASKPFEVKINGSQEVEVLGTSFNVNAYKDEPVVKTTLLEGSVKVRTISAGGQFNRRGQILQPGQQAEVVVGVNTNNGVLPSRLGNEVRVVKDVDVESVLAWKKGRFQFDGIGIHEVMKELARWYDVQVEYQGTIKDQHFRGSIPRSATMSSVFTMLESTGAVNFSIKDKKIIVMP